MRRMRSASGFPVLVVMLTVLLVSGCLGPKDSDGDGSPDEDDHFPEDSDEWLDSDNDGVGDNADAFPNDSEETSDSDGDGFGDNLDDFPSDPEEWYDTDGDGYGDNSDTFPDDWEEWYDTDGDGYGDNSDDFPDDPGYHLICPECEGTGQVPEKEEINHTVSARLMDLGSASSNYHVIVKVSNLDEIGGSFEVQASVVLGGEEIWSGDSEQFIGPGESHEFDLAAGALDQGVGQGNLRYRVRAPFWVVGPEAECPVCGGTGKV
jgi:hypothetical protein